MVSGGAEFSCTRANESGEHVLRARQGRQFWRVVNLDMAALWSVVMENQSTCPLPQWVETGRTTGDQRRSPPGHGGEQNEVTQMEPRTAVETAEAVGGWPRKGPRFFFDPDENFFFSRQDEKVRASRFQACLCSQTTSCTGGDSPSAPGVPFRPKRDSATARAAQQPSMLPQRRLHAVSALFRRTSGALRAFARDRAVKNWRVSATSPARTNQATSSIFPRQLRVRLDLAFPCSTECCPVPGGWPCPGSPVPLDDTHKGGVDGQLNGRPCNDFQTSSIEPVEGPKIHVSDEHVGGHSGTSFTADASHHALHGKTPPTQLPCRCASCTVVAKDVEWTATPAVAL